VTLKKIKYFTILIGAGSAIFGGAFAGAMADGYMMRAPNQIKNFSLESDILAFAKIGAMAEVADGITDQVSVSFVLANVGVDPSPEEPGSGDEYFLEVVNQCSIHSEDSFEPLCFICKLSDSDGNLLAQGIVGETFDEIYEGSSTVTIDLQPDPLNPQSHQVQKVSNVEVKICGPIDESESQGISGDVVTP